MYRIADALETIAKAAQIYIDEKESANKNATSMLKFLKAVKDDDKGAAEAAFGENEVLRTILEGII